MKTAEIEQTCKVAVYENEADGRPGWIPCLIDKDLRFSTQGLQSYFFAGWEPIVYDAMLVAAAAEYCDRLQPRSSNSWRRSLAVRIPVHDPAKWNRHNVRGALQDALNFLTGDVWSFDFTQRARSAPQPAQKEFNLAPVTNAVMPYSDGLDSLVVASLSAPSLGTGLLRVRVGSNTSGSKELSNKEPFKSVPFKVSAPRKNAESSFRTRGFKFMTLSGLAAYLANAPKVILPESGTGALGPALVPLAQAHPDYRNHPLFASRLGKFLEALLGRKIVFEFPQLWATKGESLSSYLQTLKGDGISWKSTRSCWQRSSQASVDGHSRQCGICAACLLRRMSVHAAGVQESAETYVWENLGAATFQNGAAAGFDERKKTRAMRDYAVAATRHLEDLAGLRKSHLHAAMLDQAVFDLSQECGLPRAEIRTRLDQLLVRHEQEWQSFVASLGNSSFIAKWAGRTNE